MQLPRLSKIAFWILGIIGFIAAAIAICRMGEWGRALMSPGGILTESVPRPRPYDAYTFDALAARPWRASTIDIGRVLSETDMYTSYVFTYTGDGRRISGMLTMPHLSRLMGVVVMARGYVDKEIYQTGVGTKNAAQYYASQGYITLAPDFSGYGESDPEDENALGARLRKPAEILDLLASLKSLPQIDLTHVYLWGHSNGGQIMLSVAEILGKRATALQGDSLPEKEPTIRGLTLWAPVSTAFPYNVLYFTDEADDKGKWLRREIATFENEYDVYHYSIDRYWDSITIPIQLHQGTADVEVPEKWSQELTDVLTEKGKDITYYRYPGTDHNMRPSWDSVVARDLVFFQANQ